MGAFLAALTTTALLSTAPPDTLNPYASAATRALVERAMVRQREQDSLVTDYSARLRYRLTISLGRRRWGRSAPMAIEEQDVKVQWHAPNDLRVDVLGRRAHASNRDLETSSIWDRPWFVPRALGDSIRIFSDEFPAIAPLHPLAEDGPRWYRYELVDSLQVTMPNGRRVKVLAVDVTPVRQGPSLIVGKLWLDAATYETVRFSFRYVGKGQWVAPDSPTKGDSSDARRANGLINRLFSLDADLEYAMQDGQYWMPYRQTISGRVTVPIVSDVVIPFEAVTTFRDYEINTGRAPTFVLAMADSGLPRDSALARWRARQDTLRKARREARIPDSLWARDYAGFWRGGRYEVHRPPGDSLRMYSEWGDSLVTATTPEDAARVREFEAELGRMAERLPDEFTGEKPVRFALERGPSDLVGFNRVQGWSLGVGIGVKVPGVSFTDAFGTVRYGFSDERVNGRLGVIRNGPGWKLTVDGYHDVVDQDAVSPGRTLGNSVNAAFTTHDNGDYMLATGGSATLVLPVSNTLDLRLGGRVEEELSLVTDARSGLNDFFGGDGLMATNAPVTEGTFVGGSAALSHRGTFGWTITTDVLSGEGSTTGRLWGEARYSIGTGAGATFRAKAGIATSPTLPQSQFRVGGQHTVRMYDYGTQRGQSFWAAQADFVPFAGFLRPVVFADVGWAGDPDNFGESPLVGAGIGVSLYSKLFRSGVIRFDLSRQLSPGDPTLRFDIILQAVR